MIPPSVLESGRIEIHEDLGDRILRLCREFALLGHIAVESLLWATWTARALILRTGVGTSSMNLAVNRARPWIEGRIYPSKLSENVLTECWAAFCALEHSFMAF